MNVRKKESWNLQCSLTVQRKLNCTNIKLQIVMAYIRLHYRCNIFILGPSYGRRKYLQNCYLSPLEFYSALGKALCTYVTVQYGSGQSQRSLTSLPTPFISAQRLSERTVVSRFCSTALSSLMTSQQQLYKILGSQKQKCGTSFRTMMSLS
jgi:hypothetical protein